MKILIVEDDFTSSMLLEEILKNYGMVQTAINGKEAVKAVRTALGASEPYNLICLDIMMPEMDGQEVLRQIRAMESSKSISSASGAKIIMTTALGDIKNMAAAYEELCDAYVVKPISKNILLDELRKLRLIE